MKILGYEIKRQGDDAEPILDSVIPPILDDGAINVSSGSGHFGTYVDIEGSFRNEIELLTKYRTMAQQPEMENAIDDIINDAIVHDEDGKAVNIEMDELDQPDTIKKLIREEFETLVKLLNFNKFGGDVFKRWYIDGRMYLSTVIDPQNTRDGIQSITFVDPRRIRKVRNIIKEKNPDGIEMVKKMEVFYIYNEKNNNNNTQNPSITGGFESGIKLTEDSVVYVTSGLYDPLRNIVLSYLHKAIRPMNQLRFIEDATIIYKVSRAPERRVFYVDVGNMPKIKAEQYLKDVMTKFRNKLVYDAATGEVRDDRKHMSMLEDFWMPRRGEGKSTEITTLPAGTGFDNMDSVLYFEKKLYRALMVPASRLESSDGFNLGKPAEINRDELKFDKFIDKLRNRFSILFDELLERQLTLRGICTKEEWSEFKQDIHYRFIKDNNFTELKETELLKSRIEVLGLLEPFVGRYYSVRWIKENVCQQDEDEIEKMQKEMDKEADDLAKDMADQAKKEQAASDPMSFATGQQKQESGEPVPSNDPDELNNRVKTQFPS